jgi:hypothetical protein
VREIQLKTLLAHRYADPSWQVHVAILEKPQIYRGDRQKGDQRDLIEVAVAGARVAQWLCPGMFESFFPAEWMGQRPKHVTASRAEAILSDTEKTIMMLDLARINDSDHHNAWDAVGLGLWRLGRLPK